jgi:hypothetical protein
MSKKSIPVFVPDNQKYIPEPDLKLLLDFLRLAVDADLEFQAVYEAVMGSLTVQTRLFKALSDRVDGFVDVRISRKPRRIILKFSGLPQSLVSAAFAELVEKQSVVVPVAVAPSGTVQAEPVATAVAQSKPVTVNQVESVTLSSEPVVVPVCDDKLSSNDTVTSYQVESVPVIEPVKRKGRGKAKKQAPARSLVTVLIDNSDLELLNELAIKKDYNVSQLIRLAVRRLVSSHPSSF